MRISNRRAAYTSVFTLAAALLTGCSTVSSIDLSTATDESLRKGAYLDYAVAKSVFQIQIAAATNSAQAPATSTPTTTSPPAAGAAAPAAAPAAPAAAPAVNPAPATPPLAASTAAQPVDASMCSVLTAEYTAGQTAVAGNIALYATLLARISQMEANKPAPKDTPKILVGDLRNYLTAVRDPAYLTTFSTNTNTIYGRIVNECAPKVTVSIQQMVVPDTARTFALRPRTNILYTDALTFGIDSNGFITNGAPGSTSQVTAMASAIAGDIGTVLTPGAGAIHGIGPAVAPGPAPATPPKPSCVTSAVPTVDDQINDLETCADAMSARALLAQIGGDLDQPGAMMNLPATTLPLTAYVPLEDLEDTPAVPTNALLKFAKDNLKVSVTFTCSLRNPKPPTAGELPENAPANNDSGDPRTPGVYDGIVVSAARACEFTARQDRTGLTGGAPLAFNHFWAQDSRYLTLLPTTRGFLVQRTVGYTFANGQATGVSDSRPSEALAIVSFPGTVLGSFFSGVTAAATNNQAFNNAKTAGLNAQYSNLQAQVNVLNEQAALKTAKAAATAPSN